MPANSKQQVLDLLNRENNTFFTEEHLTFGVPQPNPEGAVRNTSLLVTSKNTSAFNGSVTINYNRLDLAVLFAAANLNFTHDPAWLTTHDLLAAINQRFNLLMEPVDIINDPIDTQSEYPLTVTLRAHANSYAYIGQCQLTLQSAEVPVEKAYNQNLSGALAAANESWSWPDGHFATYRAGGLEFALTFAARNAQGELVTSASDIQHLSTHEVPDDQGWYLLLGLTGSELRTLTEAGRLRVRFDHVESGESYGYDLQVYEGEDGLTYELSTPGNPVAEVVEADGQTCMLRVPMNRMTFQNHFAGENITENTAGYLLGAFQATLELYDSTGELDDTHGIGAVISLAGGENPAIGEGGFVVATQSRTFLADRLTDAVIITDVEAPTGFPLLVAGRNGEIFALNCDWLNFVTTLRYSRDKGLTWQEKVFPGYGLNLDHAVFFKGQLYVSMERVPGWTGGSRVMRLVEEAGDWRWEYLLDTDGGVTGMTACDERLTVADQDDFFYHTSDGVTWEKEAFTGLVLEGQSVRPREIAIAYVGTTLVGACYVDGGSHFAVRVVFVRTGPGAFTLKRPALYAGEGTDFTWTFDHLDAGRRGSMFVVGSRWFILTLSTFNNGSARTRGDIHYTDDLGDTWVRAASNSGIIDAQFRYDGQRLLIFGRKWNAAYGSAGWVGLSLDTGQTWEFDQQISSPFGEHRNELYAVAERRNEGVSYPSPVPVPALSEVELFNEPSTIYTPHAVKWVTALARDGFAVGGNFRQTEGAPADGMLVFGANGLREEITLDLVEGAYLNTGLVNDVADVDPYLVIVGNFTSVNGTVRNGIAKIDRVNGGAVDQTFHNPVFLNENNQPALLLKVERSSSGKFYVFGKFVSVDGHPTPALARLNADGTVDTSFTSTLPRENPTYDIGISVLHALSDDRVFVSAWGLYASSSNDRCWVVLPDGAIDTTFTVTAGWANAVTYESSGQLTLFGGDLRWNGTLVGSALRLEDQGTAWVRDSTFQLESEVQTGQIEDACLLSDGTYFIYSTWLAKTNGWSMDNVAFVDRQGQERVGYTRLDGLGGFCAVNSLDHVLMAAQLLERISQAAFPRRYGVDREGIVRFRPLGAPAAPGSEEATITPNADLPNRFLLDEPPDSTNITYAGGQGNYLLYQQADLTMGVRAYPTQGTLQSVLDTGSGKQRYVFDEVNEYGFPTGQVVGVSFAAGHAPGTPFHQAYGFEIELRSSVGGDGSERAFSFALGEPVDGYYEFSPSTPASDLGAWIWDNRSDLSVWGATLDLYNLKTAFDVPATALDGEGQPYGVYDLTVRATRLSDNSVHETAIQFEVRGSNEPVQQVMTHTLLSNITQAPYVDTGTGYLLFQHSNPAYADIQAIHFDHAAGGTQNFFLRAVPEDLSESYSITGALPDTARDYRRLAHYTLIADGVDGWCFDYLLEDTGGVPLVDATHRFELTIQSWNIVGPRGAQVYEPTETVVLEIKDVAGQVRMVHAGGGFDQPVPYVSAQLLEGRVMMRDLAALFPSHTLAADNSPTGYFRFFLRRYNGSTLISKAVIDAEIQLMEAD